MIFYSPLPLCCSPSVSRLSSSLTWIVMNCWKICTRRRRRPALYPARLDARRRFVSSPSELTALKRGRIKDPRSSGSKRRGHWKRITNCRSSSSQGRTRTCVWKEGEIWVHLRGTTRHHECQCQCQCRCQCQWQRQRQRQRQRQCQWQWQRQQEWL